MENASKLPTCRDSKLLSSVDGRISLVTSLVLSISFQDNTISVGEQTKSNSLFSSTLIFKRDLVIQNVALTHQRTYRCESIDDDNNTYYHNFRLKVRESPDDFVILREAQNRTIIHRKVNSNGEMLPIEIIIHYKSYPALSDTKSYEWSREEAAVIISNGDYKHNVTPDYINLRINHPTIQNSDIYTLAVHAGTAKAMYNISIFVHGESNLQNIRKHTLKAMATF